MLGSAVVEDTLTMFVIIPGTVGLTVTTILLSPPPDSVPMVHWTLPPRLTQPGDAETNVTLAGSASVIVTLVACDGPRLVTAMV